MQEELCSAASQGWPVAHGPSSVFFTVVDFWSGIVGPLGVLWCTSAITRDLHRFASPQGVDKQKGQRQVSASLAA